MKRTISIFALLFFITGCFNHKPVEQISQVLRNGYFQLFKTAGDLSVGVRELHMKELKQLFWNPQDIDDQYKTIHVRISNRGAGVHFLYPTSSDIATKEEMVKLLNPEQSGTAKFLDSGGSIAAGITTVLIVHKNTNVDPIMVYLLSFTAFSIFTSIIKSLFYSADKYEPVYNYMAFKAGESNPLITIKPFVKQDIIYFVKRDGQSERLSYALTKTNGDMVTEFHVNLAQAL